MPNVTLLSNGSYHVVVAAVGSSRSRWNDLAVTRWREDAALDDCGTFFFVHDAADAAAWPVSAPPGSSAGDRPIATLSSIAVAADCDIELRRLQITNRSSHPRALTVTSYSEIVLSPAATDAAHLAFSKLFVETEFDEALGAILASRRPSAAQDSRPWYFHAALVHGAKPPVSYETDRMRFVGRGRSVFEAEALCDGAPLSGQAGAVLDAIAAIRVPMILEAGTSCTIDWFAGIAASRGDCRALASRCRETGAGDRIIAEGHAFGDETLRRIGASAADAVAYERLARNVLYAAADLRADPGVIAKNERGQSSLWGLGLSGDVPIVLVRVTGSEQLELVQQFVRAHAFWRAHGIKTELMIVSAAPGPDGDRLFTKVKDAVGAGVGAGQVDKPAGIFMRDDATLDDGDRTLLKSVARIAASEAWPRVLERLEQRSGAAPPRQRIQQLTPATPAAAAAVGMPGKRIADNGHGGFAPDLREYVVELTASHMTPAPWTNVIANAEFGTLVSESGSATTWSENAHEFRLTPWSNDPVSDPNSEALYLRDEVTGRFWSPTLLPTRGAGTYLVRHGFGYSIFEHSEDGIDSTLRIHVAVDAPVKFSTLTLRNRCAAVRRLSVTGCLDWVLGDERAKTLMHVVTERDPATGAIFARNGYQTDFPGRVAFFDVDVDADGSEPSACGDRSDFFGRDGTRAAPAAMAEALLTGRLGAALDPCAALRVSVELAAGEEREITFRLGAAKSADEARALVLRWRGAAAAHAAFEAVRIRWRETLATVEVQTPDLAVNALVNGWLLYQVLASRLWGRTAFYQSSGAFGFRDQLQDVMALVHAEPGLVREHLLRSASRQFVEGDVQHWWHPPSGKGVRTRCSDDYLWLPFVTARYVEVTGDAGVLDASCPFLDSRPLKDDEQSNYELPTIAAAQASLYEHCVRAIRHGLRYGARGLPLMGAGDWNDGMNLVGAGGKGESVWLAFFLIAVLQRFAPFARSRGDAAFAALCTSEATAVRERVEATSWDGDWYRRGYFDDGTPLGSAANTECRIDSIAQSWAVLSGAAPAERARTAMASVHRQLVHVDRRLVQLLDPPFDTSRPSPGYIQGYVPGVRENGGQYTHAAVWAGMAFAALGDADRAWEIFRLLAPIHHGDSADAVATYRIEPYVVAGDVYDSAQHAGRGGWSWYTGSAGWMYQWLVESLLGIERLGDRLRVRPLLPTGWPGFEMDYRFGRSTYRIACRAVAAGDAAKLSVDGVESADGWIALINDGGVRRVAVSVAREPRLTQLG